MCSQLNTSGKPEIPKHIIFGIEQSYWSITQRGTSKGLEWCLCQPKCWSHGHSITHPLHNHYLTISHTTSQPHLPQTPSFPGLLFISTGALFSCLSSTTYRLLFPPHSASSSPSNQLCSGSLLCSGPSTSSVTITYSPLRVLHCCSLL